MNKKDASQGFPGPAPGFRFGYVALVGRPNVGKSTLLNQVLGSKIAIISHKPNTTRTRIVGVKTMPNAQMVFFDTPGIHVAKKELNKYMVAQALQSAREAELIYLMIDAAAPWREEDLLTLSEMQKLSLPLILVVNKIDLVEKGELLPLIDRARTMAAFKEIIPVSALKNDGIDRLLAASIAYLPEGPQLFPTDTLTDQAERVWAAELVREKIINLTSQEIPYATAVVVEEWEETEKLIHIGAVVYVERDSQKGIIIGQGGKMIKNIGTAAREEIEMILGAKIFLELRVKVSKDWTRSLATMKKLGYT